MHGDPGCRKCMQIKKLREQHVEVSAKRSAAQEAAARSVESQKAAQKHLASTQSEVQYWRRRATDKHTKHLTAQTVFSITLGEKPVT
jgi:hypothetical protein